MVPPGPGSRSAGEGPGQEDEESSVGGDEWRPSWLWFAAPRVTTWGQQRVRTVSKGGRRARTQAMGKCSQPQPCSWTSKLIITSAKVHTGPPLHLFSVWRPSSHSPSLRSSSFRELAQVTPRLSKMTLTTRLGPRPPNSLSLTLDRGSQTGVGSCGRGNSCPGFPKVSAPLAHLKE